MTTSVISALDWWARTEPDRVAIVLGEDSTTYGELGGWSSRGADLLIEQGVVPGDRVGLLASNTLTWISAAYAVIRAGGVLVPLNPRLVATELHKLVSDSGTTRVVAEADFGPVLQQVAELGASFETLAIDKVEGMRLGGPHRTHVVRDADAPAFLLFTSGSTGLSKGVIGTERRVLDTVFENSLREPGIHPGLTSLLVLPFPFTPGLVWGILMCGVLGGTLIAEPAFDPSRAVRLIEQHKVEMMFGVPLIYQALASAPEFQEADVSSVRFACIGGAAVPVPLLRTWAAKGVALRQIYGMTEVGGIGTATLSAEATDHPGSCGIGSIFTDIMVIDESGAECAPGETGEILLRGPGMSPGYYNDPDTTAQAFRGGWLHSGDLGVRDEDGRLTFVDRLKDLIISGGINLSPIEIEAVIMSVPGVQEVAVLPATDEKFGETPAAVVYGSEDMTVEAIIAECDAKMASYKVPRYVVVRDQPLPRLPSGKISKRDLRVEYSDLHERFDRVR